MTGDKRHAFSHTLLLTAIGICAQSNKQLLQICIAKQDYGINPYQMVTRFYTYINVLELQKVAVLVCVQLWQTQKIFHLRLTGKLAEYVSTK